MTHTQDANHLSEIVAKDARHFLEILSPNNDEWGAGRELDWIFRGVRDCDFDLHPAAWRADVIPALETSLSSSLLSQPDYQRFVEDLRLDANTSHRVAAAVWQKLAESQALADFSSLADQIGIGTDPYDRPDPFADLKKLAIGGVADIHPPSGLMALAQHHGTPTRLMDWTANPIAAAFFAIDRFDPSAKAVGVYALQKSGMHFKKADYFWPEIYRPPRHVTPYMVAQRGCFTLVRGADRYFVEHGRWPTFDEAIQVSWTASGEDGRSVANELFGHPLLLIKLSSEHVPELLKRLWRYDMSRAHLMPTLDNVSAALRQLWSVGMTPAARIVERAAPKARAMKERARAEDELLGTSKTTQELQGPDG